MKLNSTICLSSLLHLFIIFPYASLVRLSELIVPSPVVKGDEARLFCLYDLEGSQLYSMKWYKDDDEFFRYVPGEPQQIKTFPTKGIDLNLAKSNGTTVMLTNVRLETGGGYKCEVSGESPYFQTNRAQKRMVIYVLPEGKPEITGNKEEYNIGDTLNVNCTTRLSKPPATIIWYINGQQAKQEYLTSHFRSTDSRGLSNSTLGLNFRVTKTQLNDGSITLKCLALVGKKYSRSRHASSVEGYRRLSSVMHLPDKNKVNKSGKPISMMSDGGTGSNSSSQKYSSLDAKVFFIPTLLLVSNFMVAEIR
ncbi:Uncharacterised protein g1195 [Pycnogonum litorale]